MRILSFIIAVLLLAACTDLEPDRLYAVRLDHVPIEADWRASLPKTVHVKGGRLNKVDPLPEVDKDMVHVSTASCHHGSSLPDPVPIEIRAFYTATDLYLHLSWPDATRNDNMRGWSYDGSAWQSDGSFEDGLGILWDIQGRYQDFTCSYACHLDDFGVSGRSFRGHNRMKLNGDGAQLDLWHWKAGRTGHLAFADDRFIDKSGMYGDLPGELFHPNSLNQSRQRPDQVFAEGDRPLYDEEGRTFDSAKLTLFSRAPGYLSDRPVGDRADVGARAVWRDGRWNLTLRRALKTASAHDIQFAADGRVYAFGISLMDNSLYEHYASTLSLGMVLLPQAATGGLPR